MQVLDTWGSRGKPDTVISCIAWNSHLIKWCPSPDKIMRLSSRPEPRRWTSGFMCILVTSRGYHYYAFKISPNQLALFPYILVVPNLGHPLEPPRMLWKNCDVCAPSYPNREPLEGGRQRAKHCISLGYCHMCLRTTSVLTGSKPA